MPSDRQTEIEKHTCTDKWTEKHKDGQTDTYTIQIDRHKYRWTDRYIHIQMDRQTIYIWTDRNIYRWTDINIDRQT